MGIRDSSRAVSGSPKGDGNGGEWRVASGEWRVMGGGPDWEGYEAFASWDVNVQKILDAVKVHVV